MLRNIFRLKIDLSPTEKYLVYLCDRKAILINVFLHAFGTKPLEYEMSFSQLLRSEK